MLKTLKRLFGYFKPHTPVLLVSVVALLVFSLVDAGMLYFVQPLIDDGLAKSDSGVLKIGAILVVVIFLLRGVASYVANYAMAYVSSQVVYSLRQQMFAHLQRLPMSYLERRSNGSIISKFNYDVEQLASISRDVMVICIRESVIVVVLLLLMFYVSWQLSLIFLIAGPAVGLVIAKVSRRFKQVSAKIQDAVGSITEKTEQSIKNHREILALATADIEARQFAQVNNHNRQQVMKLANAAAISNPLIQLIAATAIAVVLWLASIPSVFEQLTAGSFTTTLVAMGSLLRPLKQLSSINQQLQKGLAAADSVFSFIDTFPEKSRGTEVLERIENSIVVKNLSFNYVCDESLTLQHISLTIPVGKKTAIVGASGSGKSTLLNLLMGFYPVAAQRIFVDEKAIETFTLASLRQQFSLVSQQIVLIDDSIAANIAYGCPRPVTREQIEQAADQAMVSSFAKQLPLGLDSAVGDNGCQLSGGQRQRIAIARAILRDAPVLILDEATSALDSSTERAIRNTISQMQREKTIVIVSHNLQNVRTADHILVLAEGRLQEQGTHEQLLASRGVYYQLALNQSESVAKSA